MSDINRASLESLEARGTTAILRKTNVAGVDCPLPLRPKPSPRRRVNG